MPRTNSSSNRKYSNQTGAGQPCECIGGVCAIDPSFISKLKLAAKAAKSCAKDENAAPKH